MKKITIAALLACSAMAGAHADTINGLVNTGAGLSAGAQDSNYEFSVLSGSTVLPSGAAFVTQDSVWPITPWLDNTTTSKWITPTANQAQSFDPSTPGTYKFELTFNLSGYDASSASFTGRFSADNAATVLLNGQEIGSGTGFTSWTSFAASSGFHTGLNTLDFDVTNYAQNGGNPLGLRVEFTGSSVSAVPEPASYAMLIAGMAMLGFAARRRKAS